MDYIKPAHCTEADLRSMWTESEWENKVNINTRHAKNLRDFLDQAKPMTNMSCLTAEDSFQGDCQFLSFNLYAKSVFGKFCVLERIDDCLYKKNIISRTDIINSPYRRAGPRVRSSFQES